MLEFQVAKSWVRVATIISSKLMSHLKLSRVRINSINLFIILNK